MQRQVLLRTPRGERRRCLAIDMDLPIGAREWRKIVHAVGGDPWQPIVALLGAESLFLAWWYRLKPSNDRDWDPSMAVLPRALIAGDAVTIENVRNLEYRSIDDFEPNDLPHRTHSAGSSSLRMRALRAASAKLRRGCKVITDSGQVFLHNPHCTQASS